MRIKNLPSPKPQAKTVIDKFYQTFQEYLSPILYQLFQSFGKIQNYIHT